MVEVAQDPLDPPKFQHRKVPVGFGDAPVPILHSPPRKVTVQDQQDWKIPPCISNWKNARGLTIPLDKRLAADGRGLQQTVVNDNFATFAEAMQAAESKMREEVELRNSILRKQKEKERVTQDELMRQRAAELRQEHEDMERAKDKRETAEEREARLRRDKQREEMRAGPAAEAGGKTHAGGAGEGAGHQRADRAGTGGGGDGDGRHVRLAAVRPEWRRGQRIRR